MRIRRGPLGFVLAAAVAVPSVCRAQGIVAKAGVNFATLRLGPENPAVDPLIGLVGGLAVEPRVHFLPGLQVELLYSLRGTRAPSGLAIELGYLAVPLIERIKVSGALPMKIHVFIGLEFDYRISAKLRSGSTPAVDFEEFIARSDRSWLAGFDVEIQRLVLELRYTRGTLNVAADPGQVGDDWRGRAIGAMAGWRFK
jgi:Outer membrane protein beta-barrel domain